MRQFLPQSREHENSLHDICSRWKICHLLHVIVVYKTDDSEYFASQNFSLNSYSANVAGYSPNCVVCLRILSRLLNSS